MIEYGQIWRHFKGNLYSIIGVGIHTETGEEFVVYCRFTEPDGKVWIRPKENFLEELDKDKYPEATQKHRFEREN